MPCRFGFEESFPERTAQSGFHDRPGLDFLLGRRARPLESSVQAFAGNLNEPRMRRVHRDDERTQALRIRYSGHGEAERQLEKITGWRVVPVAELVPDEVFFNH